MSNPSPSDASTVTAPADVSVAVPESINTDVSTRQSASASNLVVDATELVILIVDAAQSGHLNPTQMRMIVASLGAVVKGVTSQVIACGCIPSKAKDAAATSAVTASASIVQPASSSVHQINLARRVKVSPSIQIAHATSKVATREIAVKLRTAASAPAGTRDATTDIVIDSGELVLAVVDAAQKGQLSHDQLRIIMASFASLLTNIHKEAVSCGCFPSWKKTTASSSE